MTNDEIATLVYELNHKLTRVVGEFMAWEFKLDDTHLTLYLDEPLSRRERTDINSALLACGLSDTAFTWLLINNTNFSATLKVVTL